MARKIGEAVRSFASDEGLDRADLAIAGIFDEETERIYLIVGSFRQIDERRWHLGIMNAIRNHSSDMPGMTSRLVLVVRNVSRIDEIYNEMVIGDNDIDITEMF